MSLIYLFSKECHKHRSWEIIVSTCYSSAHAIKLMIYQEKEGNSYLSQDSAISQQQDCMKITITMEASSHECLKHDKISLWHMKWRFNWSFFPVI